MRNFKNVDKDLVVQSILGVVPALFLSGLLGTLTWRIFDNPSTSQAPFMFYVVGALEVITFSVIVWRFTCRVSDDFSRKITK